MRWLIWTVLFTLAMLLATTDASTFRPNLEIATKNSKLAATFPARALSSEYNSNEKRILRGNNNKISTSELKTEDEERGILDSLVNKLVTRLFKWLYNRGETPLSLRTKMMGHDYFLVGDYKVWWEQVRATGRMPKWQGNGRS
ncbi:hypothetical protein GQ600_10017 [Phytophthora cactorum]|nr:hypothetical protein GQ600_10017 [Phytophthora cactorum]